MAIITNALEKRGMQNSPLLAWMVSLSGGLLFFYEFIQLNMINAINAPLMKSFHIGAHGLGQLSSAYFFANAGFLFFAGNILDRSSVRKWIIIAMVLCTVGTLGFAMSSTVTEATIFRFVIGIGGSFCFLGGVRLASRWFPPRRMALLTGLLVTMAMIGGWLAQAPYIALVQMVGWRTATIYNGLLGVGLTAWIFLVIKDRPQGQEDMKDHENKELKALGLWRAIKQVLVNRQNWFAGLYTCLMNLPIYLLGAMWGTLFLTQIHHFKPTDAGFIAGMVFTGTIFGSPVMGWISDKIGNRRIPMIIGAILSFIVVLPIIYDTTLSFSALLALFFALGFITSSQVISYPTVAEGNPRVLTGAAISIVSMSVVLGGAIMQPISGWILDSYWNGKIVGGVHIYSLSAYQHAMLLFPAAFVLSLVLAFFLKETHCKRNDEEETLTAADGHHTSENKAHLYEEECVEA